MTRQTIDSDKRKNYSKRADKGRLEVTEGKCPKCKHKKILRTYNRYEEPTIIKCAKCKFQF